MKKLIVAGLIIFAAHSCEKKPTETLTTSKTDSIVVPETNEPIESSTVQTCYVGATGKDSVFVSLDDNLGTIIGKMRYKNFEKDSSSGDIIGTKNGDTLKLTYTFTSEGTTSDREIYFLQKEGKLIEAIGEHKVEGNKDFYADPAKVTFTGNALSQVDCVDFDKNFSAK